MPGSIATLTINIGIPGDFGLHDTPRDPLGAVHGAPEARLAEELVDLLVPEGGSATLLLLPAAGRDAGVEHELDDGTRTGGRGEKRRRRGGDVAVCCARQERGGRVCR